MFDSPTGFQLKTGLDMWNISKVVKKGKYLYASIPDHPKATDKGYVLEHRARMENLLKRLLTSEEIVHHIDHNTHNNDISNLELMTRADHAKHHGKETLKNLVDFKCPWCGSVFTKPRNNTHLVKPSVLKCSCCSPSCRGKLTSAIQYNGLSDELSKAIDDNVIREYKGKL